MSENVFSTKNKFDSVFRGACFDGYQFDLLGNYPNVKKETDYVAYVPKSNCSSGWPFLTHTEDGEELFKIYIARLRNSRYLEYMRIGITRMLFGGY